MAGAAERLDEWTMSLLLAGWRARRVGWLLAGFPGLLVNWVVDQLVDCLFSWLFEVN